MKNKITFYIQIRWEMINTESGIQESKNLGSKLIKEDIFSSLVKAGNWQIKMGLRKTMEILDKSYLFRDVCHDLQ